MKVLIAYDGSPHAELAIGSLSKGGLPRDSDILIASVADFSDKRSTYSEFDLVSAASARIDAVIEQARHYEAQVLGKTQKLVSKVCDNIRRDFPGWNVQGEVLRGQPAEVLLVKAAAWDADLIICGARGRSALERIFLGSVSSFLAEKADCSVRIVRQSENNADLQQLSILVCITNPDDASRLVSVVGKRLWPEKTHIRLVAADNIAASAKFAVFRSSGKSIYETAADRLRDVCLKVTVQIEAGDPEAVFLAACEDARADAIFLSGGHTKQRLEKIASNLLMAAKCTVEVVR